SYKLATKGNLGEVVTTCERSWVKPRRGGCPPGAKKEWGLSPKANVRVLHTAQLDVTGFFGAATSRASSKCSRVPRYRSSGLLKLSIPTSGIKSYGFCGLRRSLLEQGSREGNCVFSFLGVPGLLDNEEEQGLKNMSSIAKFDVKKFDGSNDFRLWRVKMRCLLIQHGWEAALDPFTKTMANAEKTAALNTNDLKKRTNAKDDDDGLYVRGRSDHRDCPKRNKKKSTGFVKKNAGQGSGMHSEGYDNGDLLMPVSGERFLEWIMESGGSFHMTARMDFLFDFKEFNGGTALLGDNRACTIRGTGKVRVKMKDGSSFMLKNMRYIPELKRNLISLGILDREGYTVKFQNGRVKTRMNWKKEVLENKGLGKLELCENFVLGKSTKESGIARHLTVAETPQPNGLAEQMNRKLLNKVRCLLIQSGLPDSFYAEATATTTYLINRSPSTALEKKTHMDLWLGNPSNYEMLRIFGCVAYSHVNQGKLKPKAIKCIFLRDLVFNESLMYKDTLEGAHAVDSRKEVEFEVELQGSRVEPTMDPHTGENPGNKDEEQDEGPQQQNLDNDVLVRNRGKRTTTIPARYKDEGNVSLSRPTGSREAINSSEKDEWVRATKEEMSSLKEESYLGIGQSTTWAEDARRFTQRAWIDYNELFSHVVRHTSIRVILLLASCEDYELEQLDVKTAFLHGNLEETIYMRQPPCFDKGTGKKVCLLKKSLYGLSSIQGSDDILIACKSKTEIKYTKGLLRKEFDMKKLGPTRKILGTKIVRDRGSRTLKVSQSRYVQKILNNYKVDNGKSVSMLLGAHFKVSLNNCPLSDWDMERMSKVPYVNVVGKNHWEAVKWILKYLKGTANVGRVYGRNQGKHMDVDGFGDADKDPDKGRSITGYVFMVYDFVVSWKTTLQHVEAKYMALIEDVKESIWLKRLLIELGVNLRSAVVNCDNQSAIHLSRNAMFHERTKHINVRYHFIREIVESKEIEVAKIGTNDNATDAFTNVVPGPKFKYCMEILGFGVN
nr:retrovirus-related Pol polyprotein from transposon TNT 1-94 [Tanacetum cinerariifolium]